MTLGNTLIKLGIFFLISTSASGRETTGLADPTAPGGSSGQPAAPAPDYRVSGTLVSPSKRVAIFNGRLAGEGDRVDGAEIVTIDPGYVRIRAGGDEHTILVGAAIRDPSSISIRRGVGGSTTSPAAAPDRAVGPTSSEALAFGAAVAAGEYYGPVKRGETLSGIAARISRAGVTLNQMMMALFEINPEAFDGNINVLHEGVVLRVPDGDELGGRSPEFATLEVARHETDWMNTDPLHADLAETPARASYGPVRRGETLSGIAQRVSRDGATLNQMMMALFEINPEAFDGNINILHEGAVLQIPSAAALRNQTHAAATAEVARQTQAWRTSAWQQARLTRVPTHEIGGSRLRGGGSVHL